MTTLLSVKNISVTLGNRKILDNVSLDMEAGGLKVLIGPSGAGKSTLLQCINHLIVPDEGEIYLEGKKINTQNFASTIWPRIHASRRHAPNGRACDGNRSKRQSDPDTRSEVHPVAYVISVHGRAEKETAARLEVVTRRYRRRETLVLAVEITLRTRHEHLFFLGIHAVTDRTRKIYGRPSRRTSP